MILCNFNINNLFVRYKFGRTFPGDMSNKSFVEDERYGYLPLYQKGSFEIFNAEQRKLAALTRGGKTYPDVICLQEVESLIALRAFNEQFLKSAYPYALVIDSHDLRQIDVGILSKYPIVNVRSHMDERDKDNDNEYVFSRDCLEATIQLKKNTELTLFINHFKSKLVQGKTAEDRQQATERANLKRKKQAEAVKNIVKERFPGSEFNKEYFAILGDFNDMPEGKPLAAIIKRAGLIDVLAENIDEGERWTHYYKSEGSVSQLDHILLSPALAKKLNGIEIERRGIGFKSQSKKDNAVVLPQNAKLKRSDDDKNPLPVNFQFKRFKNVSADNFSSDHCPIFIDLDIG